MSLVWKAGFALSLVLLAASVATPARADEPMGEISIGEGTTLENFLTSVAMAIDKPLLWDPRDKAITGRTMGTARTLRAPKSRMFTLVRGLLSFYDLAVVPVGPAGYEVYLVMDARQTQSILRLKPIPIELTDDNAARYESEDGMFVTTTMRVKNVTELRDVRSALQRVVTPQNIGNVTEVPAAGALVVTDFAPNVVAIYRLVKQMDVAPTYRRIALVNADARRLTALLRDQFGSSKTTYVAAAAGQPPSVPVNTPDDRFRIQADDRTNSVVLTGPEAWVNQVEAAAKDLDGAVRTQPPSAPFSPPAPNAMTRLAAKRVSFDFTDTPLDSVIKGLADISGEKFVITPSARQSTSPERMRVTLKVDGIPASDVLEMVVQSLSLRTNVRDDVIFVTDSKGR